MNHQPFLMQKKALKILEKTALMMLPKKREYKVANKFVDESILLKSEKAVKPNFFKID